MGKKRQADCGAQCAAVLADRLTQVAQAINAASPSTFAIPDRTIVTELSRLMATCITLSPNPSEAMIAASHTLERYADTVHEQPIRTPRTATGSDLDAPDTVLSRRAPEYHEGTEFGMAAPEQPAPCPIPGMGKNGSIG